jgi:hypothetical protein
MGLEQETTKRAVAAIVQCLEYQTEWLKRLKSEYQNTTECVSGKNGSLILMPMYIPITIPLDCCWSKGDKMILLDHNKQWSKKLKLLRLMHLYRNIFSDILSVLESSVNHHLMNYVCSLLILKP